MVPQPAVAAFVATPARQRAHPPRKSAGPTAAFRPVAPRHAGFMALKRPVAAARFAAGASAAAEHLSPRVVRQTPACAPTAPPRLRAPRMQTDASMLQGQPVALVATAPLRALERAFAQLHATLDSPVATRLPLIVRPTLPTATQIAEVVAGRAASVGRAFPKSVSIQPKCSAR